MIALPNLTILGQVSGYRKAGAQRQTEEGQQGL